ncbi:MAG: M48 family metallopeptidase [Bacteroidota bacterium]|nr:M48 family metallopeptidase [Bacteroidota bacterium]
MQATTILNIILVIISLDYLFNLILGLLNYNSFDRSIPKNLKGIYDEKEYINSQEYNKSNFRFGLFTSTINFLALFCIFKFGLLGVLDSLLRNYSPENEISLSLLFFAFVFFINDIISIPFQLYKIFVIEEKFGFNKMNLQTFIVDKFKSYILVLILGGILLCILLILIMLYPSNFWIYFWIVISLFTVFINMFYTSLIVPLFNKLIPLESGELRNKISNYAKKVNFPLTNIFVINGSKRSSKANAYFSGLGRAKKIVLFDTLIKNHTDDELVSVLAHEVGHYKKNHVYLNLIISIIISGIMLFILSKFLFNSQVSYALGGSSSFRHFEIFAFSIIYTPISTFLGILMNIKSRKNEFEADNYACKTFNKESLITALKKLSKDNLTNLTPHPFYVFINYSHPPLHTRIEAMKNS